MFGYAQDEPLSTKISKLLAILQAEIAENPRVKCLVFSQWTSMLQLVEPALHKKVSSIEIVKECEDLSAWFIILAGVFVC